MSGSRSSWPASILSRLKIGAKILLILLLVSFVSVALFGYLNHRTTMDTLRTVFFNKLTAVREMKGQQIEDYFQIISDQAISFSKSRTVINAAREFNSEFIRVDNKVLSKYSDGEPETEQLGAYYRREYATLFQEKTGKELQTDRLEALFPVSRRSRWLQHRWIGENTHPTGEKHRLTDPGDDSEYSATHRLYHPIFRDYLERFGYYDIFLINDETGDIVYSVFKEIEFATSLLTGPHKESNLAVAFRAARNATDSDFIRVEDYRPYGPSYDSPAAFIATPILDGAERIGVLAFQMPIDRINDIMTSHREWKTVGLGETGETYLVGSDYLMRNQSRFLIEDRESYLQMIRESGVHTDVVQRIDRLGTSIGLQRVETKGTRAALSGQTNAEIFPDYRGVPVLSSYRPLNLPDVQWVLMSEIDEAEAFATATKLKKRGLTLLFLFLFGILAVSVAFAKSMTRPIRVLAEKANALAEGDLGVHIEVSGGDEIAQLSRSFDAMRMALADLIGGLEQKVEDRTRELKGTKQELESVNSVILRWNPQGRVLFMNDFGLKLFGFSEEELFGKPLVGSIVPDTDTAGRDLRSMVENILAAPESYSINENQNVCKDGKRVWMAWRNKPIVNTDGSLKEILTIGIDITARVEAEAEMKQQREMLETTIESLTHPFYVINVEDRSVALMNSAAGTIAESGETTCHSLTHHRDTPCDSEDDPCPLEIVKETKKPTVVEHVHFDKENRKRYAEVHGYPIFDSEGNVRQMIEYSLDITERKETEARIRESEERLQSIIDTAIDGIIVIDHTGEILEFSPAAQRIFGYEREEALGANVTMLIPESYRELHEQGMARYLEGNPPRIIGRQIEVAGLRKDGSTFPLDLSIADASVGDEHLFTAILRDITDRKSAETKLTLQATALESAANAIVLTDPQGGIEWVNPAFLSLTGYTFDEVVGKTPRVLKSGEHPAAYYEDMWRTILKGEVWHGEVINKRKDGSLYTEEMTIAPVKDDTGEIVNFVAIKQDITARKKAERALAQQLALTRSLVDTLPNPVFVKDPATRFTIFNKAYEEAFGMQRQDYLNRTVIDVDYIPLEARERFQAEDEGVIRDGGTIHQEREVIFADGQRHHVLYWVTRFDLDDESVGGLVGILVDITGQKELERELAEANERMGHELSIGHEIQMSMLPLTFPAFPDHHEFDVYAVLHPAREVGGDFYDFFFIDENRFCFCVGDVSGKGVPSALFMAVAKTLLKSRATNDLSTASIMTHVNDEISEDNPSSMFITIFMAIMNVKTGEVVYTNAGHNPPYIIRKDDSLVCVEDRHGPVIGAVAGMTYKESTTNLYDGEIMLLFTDGVTEAMNEKKQLYSDQRLIECLTSKDFNTPRDLVSRVNRSVEQFQGNAEQFDDITILAVQNIESTAGATLNTASITVENNISEMSKVVEQFNEFAEENRIPTNVSRQMQIVFDELLNNIISYAYRDNERHEIAIRIELFGDRLTIVIEDDGVPFNPFKVEAPDTSLAIEDREIGGLGIHIVHNIMDDVSYQRGINRNIVTLVKRLKP